MIEIVEVHARTYQLPDRHDMDYLGRTLTITLADEGMVVDLIEGDEVISTYYRFIEEMVPTE